MTANEAVIVAHGSPGEPLPQDEAMADLASRVSALLPGWTVRGATLASPGSLSGALGGLAQPLVYPFFMAEGYFTAGVLPGRLRDIHPAARQLPAFGSDPDIPALAGAAAMSCAHDHGLAQEETALLLAAHGSQVSPASRIATLALARTLSTALPFRAVVTGFIEEAPHLADAARGLGQAICLPLFTLNAGHVIADVPEALASAGFSGPVLPPLGAHPGVPHLIAAALQHHAMQVAA
jgi:sirohydrochlorin ferrochelatase